MTICPFDHLINSNNALKWHISSPLVIHLPHCSATLCKIYLLSKLAGVTSQTVIVALYSQCLHVYTLAAAMMACYLAILLPVWTHCHIAICISPSLCWMMARADQPQGGDFISWTLVTVKDWVNELNPRMETQVYLSNLLPSLIVNESSTLVRIINDVVWVFGHLTRGYQWMSTVANSFSFLLMIDTWWTC